MGWGTRHRDHPPRASKNPVKTNKAAGFLNAQKGWHLARAAGEDETERSKGL